MANLLGVTNPVPGYDNTAANRNIPISPDNSQIQNIPDPSRVSGPDGRTEQQDGALRDAQGHIRYDSNFQTFLQRLKETSGLSDGLARVLLAREGTVVHSGMSEGIAVELSQVMEMLHMDQAQLLDFLVGQFKGGSRFAGPLFSFLRNAYAHASSDNVRADILNFLKNYADYSSTSHIEANLLRNLKEMADSIPSTWAEKLYDLAARLENGIAAGDRQGNLSLLQQEVFPHMSSYVEQTHDMGLSRNLLTLLTLDVARYENGSTENLLDAFHQLTGYGALKEQLGSVDDQSLLNLLHASQPSQDTKASQFADHLAAAAAHALRGEGSAEIQQAFQNLVGAMLINESVYMSVNHYILPLEWDGRMLFSEMWVDPDAEGESNHSESGARENTIRFLFKLDIQSLGLFDILLTTRNREVDIRISCPEKVSSFSKQIESAVSQIITRNGLTLTGVTVRQMKRPVTLTEVFPKIFEGRNSVNVKV